ncbi:MAG TPA: hypothetical protein V6D13_18420 [Halomicronema sp.]
MPYYAYQCYVNDKFLGWLYTHSGGEISFTVQNIEWCLKWKTEKGAQKQFDFYNGRWEHSTEGGYLKISLLPDTFKSPPKHINKDNYLNKDEPLTFSVKSTPEIKRWLEVERQKMPGPNSEIISRKFAEFIKLECQRNAMTLEENLERIDVLDTDYADIMANSADVNFELQLVKFGMDIAEARTKTNFISLMKHKPNTKEEWEKLAEAWEEACGYKPTAYHFSLIEKLLWTNSEVVE